MTTAEFTRAGRSEAGAETPFADIRIDMVRPGVLRLTIDRPKARNALRTQTLREIAEALDAAARDADVRCVVLTGGPKVFAAGADIGELAAHDATSILDDARPGHWKAIRSFPKPIVAAINGYCLGGGNELAMHADILIAGTTAVFGQPEVNLGIIPGAGGTQRLTHAVGKSNAMLMALTGAFIDAQTALAQGLVSEVTQPELTEDRAITIAETIAAKPPLAVRMAKEAVLKAHEVGLEQGLHAERRAFCQLFATEDKREGVSAFLEKRRPAFTGR
ncbi:Enoyl-CoA hydratase [Caenispirillum salinarum AK4]|uniref:Enoyl-CoA hydratase n=1 Tax=Caenispirillum salinarum AK4 TaxID=1238182 RepID=K9H112_9PROT|nr:enoyl-CoA hydratase-related protein [Caenispirillum salinarum]EKV30714.1 Enoyl-CoA hydratase [Caenispirillum salinarum AK4]